MNKKLLFLAYYFPPLATSGALRAAGFARHFSDYGFDLRVLTVAQESAYPPVGSDFSLNATLPNDLIIDRIVFPTRLRDLLQFREAIRQQIGVGERTDRDRYAGTSTATRDESAIGTAKSRLLDRIFLFPDHQNPWIRATMNHIRSLPSVNRPDVILATGNPWSSLVAASRVARKLGIPYVADFRDPWIGNPKPAQRRGVFTTAEALERRVVLDAASVVANTEELRQDFIRRYPRHVDKFVTIPNGFERTTASVTGVPLNPVYSEGGIELTYFGSVSELRNPLELLRALKEVSAAHDFSPKVLRVRFVGTWEPQGVECEALAAELEQNGFVLRESSIPHDECLRRMRESDCLLILQQNFPLQIPAKIYEYISAERPILLVGGDGATKSLMERHRLGLTCRNNATAIRELLVDMTSSRRTLPLPSARSAEHFDYKALTRDIGEVLTRALDAHKTNRSA